MEFLYLIFPFLNILLFTASLFLIIEGATQMRKNPVKAKKHIIIAGVLMLIGLGICGGMS